MSLKQTELNLSQEPSNDSLLMRRSIYKLKGDASDARNKDISVKIAQTSPRGHQDNQLYQLKESSGQLKQQMNQKKIQEARQKK